MKKKKWYTPSHNIVLFLILMLVVLIAGNTFYKRVNKMSNTVPQKTEYSIPEIPTVAYNSDDWMTYKNEIYGFSLEIPKKGIMDSPTCYTSSSCYLMIGRCGDHISMKSPDQYDQEIGVENIIQVDGWAYIYVIPWKGNLDNYISKEDPEKNAIFSSLTKGNADEAVKLVDRKPYTKGGYPPLAYTRYLYKKGNIIFSFNGTQNTPPGCFEPTNVDPKWLYESHLNEVEYKEILQKYGHYKIEDHFSFL